METGKLPRSRAPGGCHARVPRARARADAAVPRPFGVAARASVSRFFARLCQKAEICGRVQFRRFDAERVPRRVTFWRQRTLLLLTPASARHFELVAEARRDVAARGASRAAGGLRRAVPLGYQGPAGPRYVDGIFQCRHLLSGRRGVRSLGLVRGVAPRPRAGVRCARAQRAQSFADHPPARPARVLRTPRRARGPARRARG